MIYTLGEMLSDVGREQSTLEEDNGEIKGPPPGQGGQANKGALLKPHSAFIGSTEITPETAWMGVHSNARTH